MTGEATDLVARLNNAWVETVSPSPEGFRRSMVANVLNEARAAIQAHATLIEAQAAEIEEARRMLSESADLTSLCTTPERFGEAGSGEVFLRMTAHNAQVRAFLTRPTTQEGPNP